MSEPVQSPVDDTHRQSVQALQWVRDRFQEAKEWTLREHGETLRRLAEGPSEEHLPTPGSVQRNEDGGQ